jgi:S1-C subfamily serine protease
MPVRQIAALLANPSASADASNVPLSVEQENRVAWLGIEQQALNEDLARVNDVSQYTQNGQSGVIVTYVYPDSPADQAGVVAGDILLRLHLEGRPQPLKVSEEERYSSYMSTFPWDQLDDCPEEYFDQIPQPWPAVVTGLARTLTQAGFGKKFRAEFFSGGAIVMKEFEVVESPPYFDTAPRFKSDALGITVRDLTYEVRRYFQKQTDDPGVIISKVEQGSKGSVAGLRPYEIITHLNDQPVANAAAFESLLKPAGGALRLNVKRMTQGRIVKVALLETED